MDMTFLLIILFAFGAPAFGFSALALVSKAREPKVFATVLIEDGCVVTYDAADLDQAVAWAESQGHSWFVRYADDTTRTSWSAAATPLV